MEILEASPISKISLNPWHRASPRAKICITCCSTPAIVRSLSSHLPRNLAVTRVAYRLDSGAPLAYAIYDGKSMGLQPGQESALLARPHEQPAELVGKVLAQIIIRLTPKVFAEVYSERGKGSPKAGGFKSPMKVLSGSVRIIEAGMPYIRLLRRIGPGYLTLFHYPAPQASSTRTTVSIQRRVPLIGSDQFGIAMLGWVPWVPQIFLASRSAAAPPSIGLALPEA